MAKFIPMDEIGHSFSCLICSKSVEFLLLFWEKQNFCHKRCKNVFGSWSVCTVGVGEIGEFLRFLKELNFHSKLLKSHLQAEYFVTTPVLCERKQHTAFFLLSYRFPFVKQVVKQEKWRRTNKKRRRNNRCIA